MIKGTTVQVERGLTADIPIIDLLHSDDDDDDDDNNNNGGLKTVLRNVSGDSIRAIIPRKKSFQLSPFQKIVGNKNDSALLSQTSSKSKRDHNTGKKRKHTVLSKKEKDELLMKLRKERDLLKKNRFKNSLKNNRSQEESNNLKKKQSSNVPQPVTIDLIESEDDNSNVESFPNFYRPSCVDDVSSLSDCSYQRANSVKKNGRRGDFTSQRRASTVCHQKKCFLSKNNKPLLVTTTAATITTTRTSSCEQKGSNHHKKAQKSNNLTSKNSKSCPPRKSCTPNAKNASSGEAPVLDSSLSPSTKYKKISPTKSCTPRNEPQRDDFQDIVSNTYNHNGNEKITSSGGAPVLDPSLSVTCTFKNSCTSRNEPLCDDDQDIASNLCYHSGHIENTSLNETATLNLSSCIMKSTTYSLRKPSLPTKELHLYDPQQCNQNGHIMENMSQKEAPTLIHPSSSSSKHISPLRTSCSPSTNSGTDQSEDLKSNEESKGEKIEGKQTSETKEVTNEDSCGVEKSDLDDNSLDIQDQTSQNNNWFHFVEENGLVMVTGHGNENRKVNFPWPARIVSAEESDDWRLKCVKNNIHVPSNKICVILFFPCWKKGVSSQLDVPDHWWHVEFVDETSIFPFHDVDIECERLPQDIVLRFKKGLNVAKGLQEWAIGAGLKKRKKPYKCKTGGTNPIHHNVVEYGAILKIRDIEWLESSNHLDSSKIVDMINFELPGYYSQYLNHSKRRRRSDDSTKVQSRSCVSNPQDTGSDVSKQGRMSPIHELLNQQPCSHDLFGATSDETMSRVSKVDTCDKGVVVKEEPHNNDTEPFSIDLSLLRILGKQNRILSKSKESQAIFGALEKIPLKPGSPDFDSTAVLNVVARLCTRIITLENERDKLLQVLSSENKHRRKNT